MSIPHSQLTSRSLDEMAIRQRAAALRAQFLRAQVARLWQAVTRRKANRTPHSAIHAS